MKSNHTQHGLSLLEVTLASGILLAAIVAIVMSLGNLSRLNTGARDKAFAAQKAVQMLEELRAFVNGGGETVLVDLDSYADAPNAFQTVLTTDTKVVSPAPPAIANPADPLSGNQLMGGRWKFVRQVFVDRRSVAAGSRYVSVKVYATDTFYRNQPRVCSLPSPNPSPNPASPPPGVVYCPPLAEVAAIFFPKLAKVNYASQTFDIYALALDNVPGWWADLYYLKNTFDSTINDMRTRNVGLEPRLHYITQLAYGRDPYYAPYINATNATNNDTNMLWAYIYPGKISNRFSSPATAAEYYVKDSLLGDGDRLLVDGSIQNGFSLNGNNYVLTNLNSQGQPVVSVADQFNHAVRYPEELATYNRLLNYARNNNQPDPEPTLRLLLERLNDPSQAYFRNALLMNLHGELLPVPPIRNYSDAAKLPATLPTVRVVAHPEQIGYPLATTTVKLRVYAYLTNPAGGGATTVPVTTIFIPTPTAAAAATARNTANLSIKRMDGNAATTYTLANAQVPAAAVYTANPSYLSAAPAARAAPNQDGPGALTGTYDYRIDVNPSFDDYNGQAPPMPQPGPSASPGILITLYNTPTSSVYHAASKTGLNTADRLYGMDYVPNPVGVAGTPGFDNWNLAAVDGGTTRPKNSARWVITLNPVALGLTSPIKFETRIGNDLSSGVRENGDPIGHDYARLSDVSRTYAWIGSVPVTEQYQVLGDARYNPYLDTQTGNRYNWYFNSATSTNLAYVNTSDYPNFPRLQGPQWDSDDYDAAASLGFLRDGLMVSNSIFTSMAGYSFYYAGMGGEMGTDGNRTRFDIVGYPWNQGPARASTAPSAAPFSPASLVEAESNNLANEIIPLQGSSPYTYGSRLIARTDGQWFSMPWLGELYPDAVFSGAAGWQNRGNLPAPGAANASNSSSFYRAPWNTSFNGNVISSVARTKRLSAVGCASFFNGSGSTRTSRFDHGSAGGTYGSLSAGLGSYMAQGFNLTLPGSTDIYRPFKLATISGAAGNWFPPEWSQPEFSGRGTQLSLLDGTNTLSNGTLYYYHDWGAGWIGSGIVLVSPANPSTAIGRATTVVNGLAPQGSSATYFMARYAIAAVLQAFFSTGDYSGSVNDANRTVQVPLVQLQTPKEAAQIDNPSDIGVTWAASWKRWDGNAYSPATPANWSEVATVRYQLMYSADRGKTWYFAADGAAAKPGTYNSSYGVSGTSGTLHGSGWGQGSYYLRVEAYRVGFPQHYAFHQREIWINRF